MVADRDTRHACPGLLDDASTLVSENRRADGFRGPVDRIPVRVADAARTKPNEHLLGPGCRELELRDGQWPPRALQDDAADPHGVTLRCECEERAQDLLSRRIVGPELLGMELCAPPPT